MAGIVERWRPSRQRWEFASWVCFSTSACFGLALAGPADAAERGTINRLGSSDFEDCALDLTDPSGQVSTVKYRLLAPRGVGSGKRFPLVVFLHGSGDRGDDNRAQLSILPALMCRPEYRERYPCFLVAPQCPEAMEWKDQLSDVIDIVENLLRSRPIERDRVYLTGFSMGGFGAWALAAERPDLFAAVDRRAHV